jgi:high-affinity iron transporter
MDISAALPTFVITLREGVEAALVVGIVMAYLKKMNKTQLFPWIYSGIGVGIGGSVLIGAILSFVLLLLQASDQEYSRVIKISLEGLFSVIAIALLSWMLIWMTKQAHSMKGEMEDAVSSALKHTGGEWGVFSLITAAVLREGFETVLFIIAQFEQGGIATVGAIAGLLGAVGIGILLFQVGVKINLRRFFQVMGILLLLIVSGLVVTSLRHFDTAVSLMSQIDPQFGSFCISPGTSCLLGPLLWDASQFLPDRQFPGVLLKAFFGYTQRLYLIQAIAYVGFLSTVGSIYIRSLTRTNTGQIKSSLQADER